LRAGAPWPPRLSSQADGCRRFRKMTATSETIGRDAAGLHNKFLSH